MFNNYNREAAKNSSEGTDPCEKCSTGPRPC